jgi:hypothetical protein
MKNESIINWELWYEIKGKKDIKFQTEIYRLKDLMVEQKPDNLMAFQSDNPHNTGKVSSNLTPDDLVRGAENASNAIKTITNSDEFWDWASIAFAFVPVVGLGLSSLSMLWSAKLKHDDGDNFGAGLNVMFAFLPFVGSTLAAKAKPVLQKLMNGTKVTQLTREEMQIFKELGSKAPLLKSSILNTKYGVDELMKVVNSNRAKLTTLLGSEKLVQVENLLRASEGLSPVETKKIASDISKILSGANMANAVRVLTKALTKTKFVQQPNVWTHLTNAPEIIPNIVKTKKWITPGEKLENFSTVVNNSDGVLSLSRENWLSPNMQLGKFFPGGGTEKFLVTSKLPKTAFQPNVNRANWSTFEQSRNVGVLKPEFRGIENFNFYMKGDDGAYYLLDKNILSRLSGEL